MQDTNYTKERLRQFILTKLARSKQVDRILDNDNLILNGVIDSLGIMQLVAFIEATFTIKVNDEDIVPDNFESIDVIVIYVEGLRTAHRGETNECQ